MKNLSSVDPDVFDRRAASRFVALYLTMSLPPPPDDTPEARQQRDVWAKAAVMALRPAHEAEAMLAAQFVAACLQSLDCLRLAHLPDTEPATASKCSAQAVSFMRQSQTALRALQRMQAEREARSPKRVEAVAESRAKPPAPQTPAAALQAAALGLRRDLANLPLVSAAGTPALDRLLEEIAGTAAKGQSLPIRPNLGKHYFETIARRTG